ncbi:MAG: hypothetical protein ACE367_24265 [Acidimicrobiales bacterium]
MTPDGPIPEDRPPEVAAVDPVDGTVWSIDRGFLASHWTCIWDRGCPGIGNTAAPELGLGCCSEGAELLDDDEAMRISALAAFCEPEHFEHHAVAAADGVFADERRRSTRVVDGACVFLNRPGFAGGHGCALHIAAEAAGESPLDWKPSVCWQLPLRVDRGVDADGRPTATLRRWRRDDWGSGGASMASWCVEAHETYVGSEPVVDRLADEIEAIVGPDVAVQIRRAVGGPG